MILLVATLVLAQNYQGYPVAPRAAGMGGAATALGAGAGNTFYNPAAVAWGNDMTGDVAGNFFAGSLTQTDPSPTDQSVGSPRFGFQLIPSNISLEWRGLSLGPLHLSAEKWGLGVSILAPFDVDLSSLLLSPSGGSLLLIDSNERVYAIYNSIGYQPWDTLGFGISVVAMYRQAVATAVIDSFDGTTHASVVLRQNRRSVSHGLDFGMQWKPHNGLRAGFSVRLPVSAVFGFGDDVASATTGVVNGATEHGTLQRQVEPRYERPWRFNVGLGYELPAKFAVAFDISVHTPLTYISERDVKTGETLEVTRLNPVVNIAAGLEVGVGTVRLRGGFFTDHSPYADGGANLSTPQLNRYGGTFSIGFLRGLFQKEIGLLFSAGRLATTTVDVTTDSISTVRATGTEYRLVVTYSSTMKL